ncbi:MAG: M14 family zinc carboxypeptidase, partial [Desulfatirhabdiaceae bacterium]|nr:M14 family zinc carboxypeptidase [Desulfatirhabdiaceae bacterium]
LSEMTAMMSLGATEITFPLAGCGKNLNPEIRFEIHEDSLVSDYVNLLFQKPGDPLVIRIQGKPRTLPNALRKWFALAMADNGPGCKDIDRFREQVAMFQQLVSGKGYSGRRFHDKIINNPSWRFRKTDPGSNPYGLTLGPIQINKDEKLKDYVTWTGEIEALLTLATDIPRGQGQIQGLILLSKPQKKRKHIQNVLEEMFRSRGYEPDLMVLNAYKPGLCWLMEVILPELKRGPAIDRLDIFYKPFAGKDGAFELGSRWLQELFPAAELLTGQLGLKNQNISFTETLDQQDIYRILARSASDEILMDKGFSPRWTRMMYVKRRPDLGYVHPTTGGIRLWQSDNTILDVRVATDRERFWEIFQNNWLPALMGKMRSQRKLDPREYTFAFWESIRFNVWIEETDVPLGIGEERISPMEALHEDLYFVLLSRFADLSKELGFSDSLQLGRITPKTYSHTRGKNPSASLMAQPLDWPMGMELADATSVSDIRITGLHLSDKSLRIDMPIPSGGLESDALDALTACRAYDAERFPGHLGLWIKYPGRKPASDFRRSGKQMIHKENAPPGNRLLLYGEVKDWLERCDGVPHLSVWLAATSYPNRPVWALEAVLESRGKRVSVPKLRLLKPTFFCNARHHANEVSSTSACLKTAWDLATTEPGIELL